MNHLFGHDHVWWNYVNEMMKWLGSHNHVRGLSLLPKTVSTSFNRSLEISSCEIKGEIKMVITLSLEEFDDF